MTISDVNGSPVDCAKLRSGWVKATADFKDYGFVAGKRYRIHYSDDSGPCLFAPDEIRLCNGEVRPDVMKTLVYVPE